MTLTRNRPGVAAPTDNPDTPVPSNAQTRTTLTDAGPPEPLPVITPGTSPFAGFHERRDTLRAFVESELLAGTDFGPGFETAQGRKGKPILLKPGAEKIALWQGWRAVFKMDAATWSMTGGQAGTFCYICRLIRPDGTVAGEGRGAATIAEKKGWTANNAIKIAAKRAQVDAVLRTVGLSEYFTQDLEDDAQAASAHAARPQPAAPRVDPADVRANQAAGAARATGAENPAPNPKRAAYIREVRAWYGVVDGDGVVDPRLAERANAWIKGHIAAWQAEHPHDQGIDWASLLGDVANARFDNFPAGQLHG